jgi:hypothetical protein
MAKGALAAGYASQGQTGGRRGSGSTPGFADIAFRAGDAAERKMIREQTAQKEFTEAREEFQKEQQDLYGALAYEDQFDDTGITDVDAAGQKLANVLKSEYEMTQQLYRMGKIDENEVRRRNTRMKGQIGSLKSGVYDKITNFKTELDKKVQAGTDSEADHMKLRQLEAMTKNVAFGVDGSGNIEVRTPGTGEVALGPDGKVDMNKATRIPMSKFSTIMENEPGTDLNTMTDRIRNLEKAGDIYRAGSREYTRYTQPDGEGGRKLSPDQDELMSVAIKGLSPTEKLDALKKLGGDFEEMGITDADVLGYEDNPEKVKAIDDALKNGLNNKLMNELRAMESSKPYEDPAAKAARIKAATKDPLVSATPVLSRDAKDGRGDRIQYSPTDLRGLQATGLTFDDAFKRAAGEKIKQTTIQSIGEGPMISGTEAIKNAKIIGASDFIDDGIFQVEFQYDYEVPVDPKQPSKGMKTVTDVVKMDYDNLEDINKFRSGMELEPISSADWDLVRQQKTGRKGTVVRSTSRFNLNKKQ